MSTEPAAALRRVATGLERMGAPTYRVRAFRHAATVIGKLPGEEVSARAVAGTLTDLDGVGPATASVIEDAVAGREPAYLDRISDPVPAGDELSAALRGDCHTHSDASDGGSPVAEMAEEAIALGHEWMVLTDHSPRLTVANGLSADRLRAQLDQVAALNATLAPFRILTGIEVDIHDDGRLDQDEELLAELDFVVASVHSKLRMPFAEMTARMLAAVRNPLVDVLGHCTGRMVTGRGRAESEFDAEAVFGACAEHGVAVEINARPERLDPPRRLLRLAADLGCQFAVDSDAHAPGQLGWQPYGCVRATEAGIGADRVINTRGATDLLAWRHR